MINCSCEERAASIASNLLRMGTLTYEQMAKGTELPIAKSRSRQKVWQKAISPAMPADIHLPQRQKKRGVRFGREKKPLPEDFDEWYLHWRRREITGQEMARYCGQCHLVKALAGALLFRKRYWNSYLCLLFCFEDCLTAFGQHKKTDCHLSEKAIYFYGG